MLARKMGAREPESDSPLASGAPSPVTAVAAAPAPPAPAIGAQSEDEEVCYPKCVEGRGVCQKGTCFCRPPYTGTRCQREIGGVLRIDNTIACLLVFIALCLGLLVSAIAFAAHTE